LSTSKTVLDICLLVDFIIYLEVGVLYLKPPILE
jgi:hypothetical protein